MKTYLGVLLLAFLSTYFLTPLAKRLAFFLGAVDQPNERKIHKVPMPRLGGVAVFAGFCIPLATLYFLQNRVAYTFLDYEKLIASLMIGATCMMAVGFYDDVKGAGATKKFLVQIAVALGLYLAGFRITIISNPFGGAPLDLGLFGVPISVFWIVGLTNALNLLDGVDGLISGVTAIIALSLAVINIYDGNIIVALLTLSLAGSCLGFLPHNFNPAKIFMGDAGSLFIGCVLGCVGMFSLFKAVTATFILAPLLLFGLPLYDTLSVMVGRMRRGQSVFKADKTHVHHRLLRLGWNSRETVLYLYCITMLLGILAIDLAISRTPLTLLFAAAVLSIMILRVWLIYRRRTP